MASNDAVILVSGTESVPLSYVVPNSQEVQPLACNATFNGAAASGSFVPTIEIVSDAGVVVARVPTATTVAAGGSAEVTFAPFLRGASASSAAAAAFTGGESATITEVGTAVAAHNSTVGTSLTVQVAMPTGIQANDLLLVFLGAYDNTQPLTVFSIPAGWSLLYLFNLPVFGNPTNSQSTPRAAYYKVATGSESGTSVSFTLHAAVSSTIDAELVSVAFRGIDLANSGQFFFTSYILPVTATAWSIDAPAVPVARPSSQVLQILYDVKRQTSVTRPADTSLIASRLGGENSVTLVVAGKVASSAPADTWTGNMTSSAAFTSYFELCQLVLNPILTTGS